MSPTPATGEAVELLASTALTTDPSTASAIVSVADARRIMLWIRADVGAAGAYAQIIPLLSAKKAAPALGDDQWFAPAVIDSTPTDTLLTGTLPAGADYTIAPEWRVLKAGPMVIRTIDGDAGTDKVRMVVSLDVTGALWLYVACEEVVGNMTVGIDWSIAE
jgi:hypothetical protein